MVNKTPEEIEEEKRKQQEGLMGFLRGLLPGGEGGFGLGSIFMMLFVVTGLYFLARNEGVQEFVGKLFGEGGKEKVKGFIDGISAKIASWLPDGKFKDMLGLGNAAGQYLESRTDDQLNDMLKTDGGLSPDAAALIVGNRKIFFDTVKQAHDGKIGGKDDLTDDKTIFALITTQPEFVKKLLPTMLPPAGTALNEAQAKKRDELLVTLKKVVADERLGTLLSDTHRKNVLSIVALLSPTTDVAAADAQISGLIAKNGGQVPESLRAVFTKMLEPKTDGTLPTMKEAFDALLTDANLSTEEKKNTVKMVLSNPEPMVGQENVKAFETLKQSLGDAKIDAFATILVNPDKEARTKEAKAFVMNAENITAFKTFADAVKNPNLITDEDMRSAVVQLKSSSLAQLIAASKIAGRDPALLDGVKAVLMPNGKAVDAKGLLFQLMNANNRATIRQADTSSVAALIAASAPEKAATLTTANLEAMVAVAEKIGIHAAILDGANPNKPESARVGKVLNAFMDLVQKDATAFKKLTATEVSTFFRDPEYAAAVEYLVQHITPPEGNDAALLTVMQKQWGSTTHNAQRTRPVDHDGLGLAEVLADEKSVKALQNYMNGDLLEMVGWWDGLRNYNRNPKTPKEEQENLKQYLYRENDTPSKIRENAPYIEAVVNALSKAGVSLKGDAATTTPAQHAAYNKVLAESKQRGPGGGA